MRQRAVVCSALGCSTRVDVGHAGQAFELFLVPFVFEGEHSEVLFVDFDVAS
jgi:hypothetical protein